MAKINARNNREVGRWEATKVIDGGEYRYLFVMRSDGVLLGRVTPNGTYHKKGTLPKADIATGAFEAKVEAYLTRNGYTWKWLVSR